MKNTEDDLEDEIISNTLEVIKKADAAPRTTILEIFD